jgi:hypothetical protein
VTAAERKNVLRVAPLAPEKASVLLI